MQDETIDIHGQTLLVTGAAGFIGGRVARLLLAAERPPSKVIGLDSLSDYYSPQLKRARLAQLADAALDSDCAWRFVQADIADRAALEEVFADYRPSLVIHLAAQAGVRHSIESPQAYIDSNILGFFHLLEACRHHPVRHLVYASSSSVYGDSHKQPYAEHDRTDSPVSLYAATKKCDELLAAAYASLYRIPATALRLFTVYGPWGRPDMACIRFADRMAAGQDIPLFADGQGQRDFTYIDDTASGILRVLARPPQGLPPHQVLNLGRGHPVTVRQFVAELHDALAAAGALPEGYDLASHLQALPAQPGDVEATFADTTALERHCGHRADTPLSEGLRRFADWYVRWWLPNRP